MPIGDFVWTRLIVAVDAELANQLLDVQIYTTVDSVTKGVDLVNEFTRLSGIALPVFLQSMLLILGYEEMIKNNVPFEMVRGLPPEFLVALLVTGKAKKLIGHEVGDQRLRNWAESRKIDLENLHNVRLEHDETKTAFPLSLWP
jgi:hypothetical protein